MNAIDAGRSDIDDQRGTGLQEELFGGKCAGDAEAAGIDDADGATPAGDQAPAGAGGTGAGDDPDLAGAA